MDLDDASLRDRLIAMRLQRQELAEEIAALHKRLSEGQPALTPEKVDRLAVLLRDKLHHGPADLRQAYARLLLREVSVTREEITISGPKAALARAAEKGIGKTPPAVLSFVQEWRTREDSNS